MKTILCYLILLSLFVFNTALACDLCAIYNSIEGERPQSDSFRFTVAEQVTDLSKIQRDGKYLSNTAHQKLSSSITQFVGRYDYSEKVGFQFNLPYINRRFKRLDGTDIEKGTVAGIGDLSLLVNLSPYRYKDLKSTFNFQLFGGVKLPTGESDRLKEELEEGHSHESFTKPFRKHGEATHDEHDEGGESESEHHDDISAHAEDEDHSNIISSIHGHDLALGSGSWDLPFGASFFSQYKNFILIGGVQYVFRTQGDHSYEYADDLTYNIMPATYIVSNHDYTVAFGLNLSGEYKKQDRGADGISGDTGVRSVFLGPQLFTTISRSLSADIGMDFPLDINNTGTQSVISYRVKGALTYRF